jgi:uncharacterized protein with ParB-like and HNH nuclease domain
MPNNIYALQQIFSEKVFEVPDYQRGYSWEKSNCAELMEDLELLPEKFNHYTGTFVIKKKGSPILSTEGTSYNQFDVVDGQQRMTTLVILLSVLANEMKAFADLASFWEGLTRNYLLTTRSEDNQPLFKLTLNRDCKAFFRDEILTKTGTLRGVEIRSHKRLLEALSFFSEYCEEKAVALNSERDYKTWLKNLFIKITQQLKFTIYEVEEASEVGVIFEVMNNRGKELTELEKVKNYLLYLTSKLRLSSKEELAEQINETWTEIFERFMKAGLSEDNENQLLRSNWLMAYNYNKREWSGSKSIKELYNLKSYQGKDQELFEDLRSYVRLLRECSIAHVEIEQPEYSDSFNALGDRSERKSVIHWSTKLKRTRTLASFRPLLMALRVRNPSIGKEYFELIQLLEKFAFRVYNLNGSRADTGQSRLYQIGNEYFNGKIDFGSVIYQVMETLYQYSTADQFEAAWEFSELDNDWYSWYPLRYFLYEYEEHLANQNRVHVRYAWEKFSDRDLKDTIEHILPQTADSKYWRTHFTKKQHRIYLHDIGNLCLTLNNSSYSNKDFPEKKGKPGAEGPPCYSRSSLFQEQALVRKRDWTVNAIKERRKDITDWAKIRWGVTFPKAIIEAAEEED